MAASGSESALKAKHISLSEPCEGTAQLWMRWGRSHIEEELQRRQQTPQSPSETPPLAKGQVPKMGRAPFLV